jgi:hypothetical protein
MVATTKSGRAGMRPSSEINSFPGDTYALLCNSALDALNFFDGANTL